MVLMADVEDEDFQFYRIVDKYYYILVEVGIYPRVFKKQIFEQHLDVMTECKIVSRLTIIWI